MYVPNCPHKLQDGSVHIVGFVAKQIELQLRKEKPPEKFPLTLYSRLWDEAKEIVSIPQKYIEFTDKNREIWPEDWVGVCLASDILLNFSEAPK